MKKIEGSPKNLKQLLQNTKYSIHYYQREYNGYNIRHNKADQKTDYSREIWYDWMMQYYTSTILAYYKLKRVHENP